MRLNRLGAGPENVAHLLVGLAFRYQLDDRFLPSCENRSGAAVRSDEEGLDQLLRYLAREKVLMLRQSVQGRDQVVIGIRLQQEPTRPGLQNLAEQALAVVHGE